MHYSIEGLKEVKMFRMYLVVVFLLPILTFANCQDDLLHISTLNDPQQVNSYLKTIFKREPVKALRIVLEGQFNPLPETKEIFLNYARIEIADHLSHPEANELVNKSILNHGPLATFIELFLNRNDPQKFDETMEKFNQQMKEAEEEYGIRAPKDFQISFSDLNAFKLAQIEPDQSLHLHPGPTPGSHIMEFQVPESFAKRWNENPYEKPSNVLIGYMTRFSSKEEFMTLLPFIDYSFTPYLSGDITMRRNFIWIGHDLIGFDRDLPKAKME
ncbi:MAG: hypothetical protein JWQ35_1787 [Bacteriovoracaceae bacterium]|nr:hypothetical protein [Bacteriovoracaceae bacterium]